ncbi:hypothetical protein D3C87_189210 [compost metagenome]
MAFVLFVMAIGYANNLIYIFVFFLISVAFTGMVMTNKNVAAAKVASLRTENIFAQEPGRILVSLENTVAAPLWSLEIFVEKDKVQFLDSIDVGTLDTTVRWTPLERGWITPPRVTLRSTHPFGLLRAWKHEKPTKPSLVFPLRKGVRVLPVEAFGSERPDQAGLFREHRLYQNSDSPLRVDWRASARRQEMLVKSFEDTENKFLHFTWEQTEDLEDFEDRVSQLCLWIDEAEKAGFTYSLALGDYQSPVDHGYAQWHICLEKLALLTREEVS